MLFNSPLFLFVFLPVVVLGFELFGRLGRRWVIGWLALASLVFYAAWNSVFVLLLLGSVAGNYLAAALIDRCPSGSTGRKRWLILGITLNLLLLFRYKYLFHILQVLAGFGLAMNAHPVLLPLGISFFTFTQISYLVDLAQGQAEMQGPLSYLLFVTFFPHLIAGPILHHREMMPQFSANTPDGHLRRFRLRLDDVSVGVTWFLLGLAKKVLIADRLAPQADFAFQHAGGLTTTSAITGIVVYTMQLYFDFSGYSDMALGLARIVSIRFPINFDSPYKAISVTEYWQRWHITLTRYITLYLYNPFLLQIQRRRIAAGRKISRKALATPGGFAAMIAVPTMLTMLLTGIWHGAGLQFVLFGLIHGVYLTANQAWRHFRPPVQAEPSNGALRLTMMVGVYLQVAFAIIFFRSASIAAAIAMLRDVLGVHGLGTANSLLDGAMAFALFPVVWFLPNTQQILGQESTPEQPLPGHHTPTTMPSDPAAPSPLLTRLHWRPTIGWALLMALLFFAVLANLDTNVPFLYFQF